MNDLSTHKFANEKIEIQLIKAYLNTSKKDLKDFNNNFKIIPICSMVDGIFVTVGKDKTKWQPQ